MVWPVNHCIETVVDISAPLHSVQKPCLKQLQMAEAISDWPRDNVCHKLADRPKCVSNTANTRLTVPGEQWGLCWDSHENQTCPDTLFETTAHPQRPKTRKPNVEHTTYRWSKNNMATWKNTRKLRDRASTLIWSSPHIYHEKYFQVSKLFTASEIQPLSWDRAHTDTHFHHINCALGKLAIGPGTRPEVIC